MDIQKYIYFLSFLFIYLFVLSQCFSSSVMEMSRCIGYNLLYSLAWKSVNCLVNIFEITSRFKKKKKKFSLFFILIFANKPHVYNILALVYETVCLVINCTRFLLEKFCFEIQPFERHADINIFAHWVASCIVFWVSHLECSTSTANHFIQECDLCTCSQRNVLNCG